MTSFDERPADPVDDARFDAELRRSLDPSPETVARLVRHALAAGVDEATAAPHGNRRVWPWLAAAAAGIALVVALRPGSPAIPNTATGPASTTPSGLRITNEDGPLVITTTSGNRWILLDDPATDPPRATSRPYGVSDE